MTFDEMMNYKPTQCGECTSMDCEGCINGRMTFEKIGDNDFRHIGFISEDGHVAILDRTKE